jgi:hypothetical protein
VIQGAKELVGENQAKIALWKDLKYDTLLDTKLQDELDTVLAMLGEIAQWRLPESSHIATRVQAKKTTSRFLLGIKRVFSPSGPVVWGIKDGFNSGDALRKLEEKKSTIDTLRKDLLKYPEWAIIELTRLWVIRIEPEMMMTYLQSPEFSEKIEVLTPEQSKGMDSTRQGFISTLQSLVTGIQLAESHINNTIPLVWPLYSVLTEKTIVAEFSLQLAVSSSQTARTVWVIADISDRLDSISRLGQRSVMENTLNSQRSVIWLQDSIAQRWIELTKQIWEYQETIRKNELLLAEWLTALRISGSSLLGVSWKYSENVAPQVALHDTRINQITHTPTQNAQ